MTLFAQWLINQYNVTYDANGGTGTAPTTQTANYNTNVTVSNNTFTRTAYTFTGWNTAANGSGARYAEGSNYTILASNTTMYAQWASTSPSITPSTGSVASTSTTYGTSSGSQSFTFTGANLTGSHVTAAAPAGFEIATTSGGPYASTASYNVTSGGVAGTVFIRLAATADVNNYTGVTVALSDGTTSVSKSISTSTINPKAVTVSGLTGTNKVYDGNTSATVTGIAVVSGAVNTDVLGLSGTPAATYASKNVGSGVAIIVSGYTLTGVKAANYTLTSPVTGLSGNITAKDLTVTGATAQNKVYDTNTTATISGATLVGVVSPDVVTINNGVVGNASFADANVGTAKPVTANLTLGGTDAANYTLSQPTGLTANITAAIPVISPASISMGVGTTANITSSSSGVMTASSNNIGVASVTTGVNPPLTVTAGATAGTATISVSQVASADGNYSASTANVTVTGTEEAVGTYITLTGGTWPNGTATWERLQAGGGWSAATPSSSATDKLIIRHTINTVGNYAATGGTSIQVENGGVFNSEHATTIKSLIVNNGGIFSVNTPQTVVSTSNGKMTIEKGGKLILNSTTLDSTDELWGGVENFKEGSIVEIQNWDWDNSRGGAYRLISSASQITPNVNGYYFGNLVFNANPTENFSFIINTVSNGGSPMKFVENDLTINNIAASTIFVQLAIATAHNIQIAGNVNVNVNGGSFIFSTVSSTSVTHNIGGDINLNAGKIEFNSTSGGGATVNLNGNLKVANAALLQSGINTAANLNFVNNILTQTIDVANAGTASNITFNVSNGAKAQLTNDLSLGSGLKFNVSTGGTFDFNLNPSGTSAYKIQNATGSITTPPTFTANSGSVLKVTSADGLTKT